MNVRGRSDSILSDYPDVGDRTGGNRNSRQSLAERRLERDLIRGYAINVKQVVLAFAIEFVINSRVAAEARVARAIGFAWLCGGALVAFTLAGRGIVVALWGYSYMISVRPAAEQVANALVESLEHAQLKTSIYQADSSL